jgi:hypothetical protein
LSLKLQVRFVYFKIEYNVSTPSLTLRDVILAQLGLPSEGCHFMLTSGVTITKNFLEIVQYTQTCAATHSHQLS